MIAGRPCKTVDHILRFDGDLSDDQKQTQAAFDFLWKDNDRFQDEDTQAVLKTFYLENFGDVAAAPWWNEFATSPVIIDAGCGIGLSAINLFGDRLDQSQYIGTDMTTSVNNAAVRFAERGTEAAFLQCDLRKLPLPEGCADIIYSQGVLHHTDNTREALMAVLRHLKVGGRAIFYVYRKKGPIREFTDDYVRGKLNGVAPREGWQQMMALTKLGKVLGELNMEIDIPEDIALLDIPKGRINLQRLFYWHIFKAFYHPEMSDDEMNHINYDWYAPINAHRHTEEDVRDWMNEAGMEIERLSVQDAGIGVVARKT